MNAVATKKKKNSITQKNAVQIVNEKVIEELFEAAISGEPLIWQKPWLVYPKQNIEGRVYNKVNSILLSAIPDEFFLTKKQAEDMGGTITNEEYCIILNTFPKKKPVSADYQMQWWETEVFDKGVRMAMTWNHSFTKLLPISHVDGIKEPISKTKFVPREDIDGFIAGIGLKIKESGNLPHYDAVTDTIIVPDKERFNSSGEYYHTLMSQIIAQKAPKVGNDNPKEYARRDLTVSIASAAICLTFGITDLMKSTASEINRWIDAIKADDNLLINASSRADKIVQSLL